MKNFRYYSPNCKSIRSHTHSKRRIIKDSNDLDYTIENATDYYDKNRSSCRAGGSKSKFTTYKNLCDRMEKLRLHNIKQKERDAKDKEYREKQYKRLLEYYESIREKHKQKYKQTQ
jgi:hypothetical protein